MGAYTALVSTKTGGAARRARHHGAPRCRDDQSRMPLPARTRGAAGWSDRRRPPVPWCRRCSDDRCDRHTPLPGDTTQAPRLLLDEGDLRQDHRLDATTAPFRLMRPAERSMCHSSCPPRAADLLAWPGTGSQDPPGSGCAWGASPGRTSAVCVPSSGRTLLPCLISTEEHHLPLAMTNRGHRA